MRIKTPLLDPPFIDEEEKELIESFERGEWIPMKNQKEIKVKLEEAARRYTEENNPSRKNPQPLDSSH